MTDTAFDQHPSSPLARIAPVLRGLLARPRENPDIPYERVILKSLTGSEAIEFAASEKTAGARGYPAPLGKSEKQPLFLEAPDCDAETDDVRGQLSDAVSAYSQGYNSKPEVICVRDLGILYVAKTDGGSDLPLHNKVALVTGAGGAIGYAICRGLLESGCHLVATDLAGEKGPSMSPTRSL
ncbi:MAG: hypothetical protein ACYTBJ_26965 [Planctomycetota bacterium]|jgi:hypothetical protein